MKRFLEMVLLGSLLSCQSGSTVLEKASRQSLQEQANQIVKDILKLTFTKCPKGFYKANAMGLTEGPYADPNYSVEPLPVETMYKFVGYEYIGEIRKDRLGGRVRGLTAHIYKQNGNWYLWMNEITLGNQAIPVSSLRSVAPKCPGD